MKADIFAVLETHHKDNDLKIDGYLWIGKYRPSKKASGGVGMLVKNQLLTFLIPEIITVEDDGILSVKFSNTLDQSSFIVNVCYLPPENSLYGTDPESFYDKITSLIMQYEACANIITIGDFNARIGTQSDGLGDSRLHIDVKRNQHGNTFIDFVKENELAILNGRFEEKSNRFTSTSCKGQAVVDYCLCRMEDLDLFLDFEIVETVELLDQNSNLVGPRSNIPDHNILTLLVSLDCNICIKEQVFSSKAGKYLPRKECHKIFNELDPQVIIRLCDEIQDTRNNQIELDNVYNSLLDLYQDEVDKNFNQYWCMQIK